MTKNRVILVLVVLVRRVREFRRGGFDMFARKERNGFDVWGTSRP